MNVQFLHTAPILTSYDIEATEAFYTQKLGFVTNTRFIELGYLIMERGAVMLHFNLATEGSPASTMTECYITVQDIDSLYAEYEANGVIHPQGALELKPWGMKEFAVLDRDGNALRIGQEWNE